MSLAEIEPTTSDNAEGRARQHAAMRDMQRRLVGHVRDRTTDFADDVMEIPASVYSDPERLAAERREMFLKLPMLAGLTADMPKPGDTMLFDAAGPAILVTRGKDGKVNAFLNKCMHRGARLVSECGPKKRLTCPFHSWTYDVEGQLVAIPGQEAFEGVDRSQRNLTRVPVIEWHGLIFVKAHAGEEEIDIEAFLGPLADEIKQLNLAATVPIKKRTLDVAANWKFAQDTFFESYHFSSLHPTTINAHAFNNIAIHDEFGPHQRVMVAQHFFENWTDKPESEWGFVPYQGIHLIFPNSIMFVGNIESMTAGQGSERQIFGFWRGFPGKTPGESFTEMATYRPVGENSAEQIEQYENLTDYIINVIETEDYSLCADGQPNLDSSPADFKLVFGRNECALQSIHRNINALVDKAA